MFRRQEEKNTNEKKKVQSKGLVFSHDNDQLIVCRQEKEEDKQRT